MAIVKLSFVAALAFPALTFALATASPAMAECTGAADITLCSQGLAGAELSPLPYYPYPCEYDWYCSDGGMSLMYDPTLQVGQPDSGGLNAGRDRPGGLYTDD